ncbi:MAG: type I-C CRISPR-associated protein Cas8c/Csd1 [Syntrophobacteraceae bacterium]
MILQSLYDLYERLRHDPEYAIAPLGYSLQKISFRMVLKPDGTLHGIEDARLQDNKKKLSRQILVPGNTKSSGSGFNPCFLWDNTGYLLGYKPNDKDPERTKQTFQSFRDKHLSLLPEISCPPYHAVCQFLKTWNPEKASEYPILDEVGTGFGVFQIIGRTSYVHNDPDVKEWWQKQQDKKTESVLGQCSITGVIAPLSRLHQPKIKRVGDQAESLLVSFNDSAYESYGKEQSFNAPVSEDAAFRYATALNALLDGPKRDKHLLSLAATTVVFWTKEPTTTEDIFAQFAAHGSTVSEKEEVQDESLRQKIELFLKALRKGRDAYSEIEKSPDKTPFFILGLTGQAKGRIGVRFFYRDTISRLLDNLRRHYADMKIEREYGEDSKHPDPEFPALWRLLDETCPRRNGKPDRDKIPPILSGPLLRAVITGSQYPEGLFSAVIRRIHADGILNYIRACIIKGYLTRNKKRGVSMGLDPNRKEPAYRLGRLFAALEKTQGDALGKVNATIRDRFYSAASSTPGTVFPRLLRTYQHHLAKMERGKVGREIMVREILEPLTSFPAHLNLTDQGLFAIGYYHQMKDLWTSKETHEQKNGGDES